MEVARRLRLQFASGGECLNANPQSVSPVDSRAGFGTFRWHNLAQFTGAANDNIFKFTAIYAILAVRPADSPEGVTGLVGAAFALPFLLFLLPAGILADRFPKKVLLRITKSVELLALAFALVAILLAEPILLYAAVFLLSTQSAFFSPIKYGFLPEIVQSAVLARANGALQAATYVAIIAGTVLAPSLSLWFGGNYAAIVGVCLLISLVGTVAAWQVQPLRQAIDFQRKSEASGGKKFGKVLRCIWENSDLRFAVFASAGFSWYGAYLQLNLIPFGVESLGMKSAEEATFLFLVMAVGLGVGSMLAGRMCRGGIDLGLPLPAAVGMAACGMGISLVGKGEVLVGAAFFLCFILGMAGGMFLVPVETLIQAESPAELRGSVVATSNFLSWIGIFLAAGMTSLLGGGFGLDARWGIFGVAFAVLALSLAALALPTWRERTLASLRLRLERKSAWY